MQNIKAGEYITGYKRELISEADAMRHKVQVFFVYLHFTLVTLYFPA